MTRSNAPWRAALGVACTLVLGPAAEAWAQPPEAEAAETTPTPTPPVEARLAALEAQSASQAAALEQARARVAELEAAEAARAAEPIAPAAPTGPVVHPLASMFTRFEHREGYDALGSTRALQTVGCYGGAGAAPTLADSDCFRYRARVGFEIQNIQLGSDVSAVVRFLPQVTGFWAMPTLGFGGPGATGVSSSGGLVDALLGIHEASLALQLGSLARLELGRFEMTYGDNVVIGNVDWHPNGRAFDGARVRFTQAPSSYWIDAFFTLVNEGHAISLTGAPTAGGFGQGDQYFYGAYAGLGSLIDARPSTALDVYALGLQTNNRLEAGAMGGTTTEREWSLRVTIGARFRYRLDMVDFRAEGAVQTGRDGQLRDATGNFARQREVIAGFGLGEVGLNLLEDHLRIALEGNYASGDDPRSTSANEGYNQLFPTAHAFFGYTNVMGARSNIASGVLHVTGRPVDQLALMLDWHVFVVPERGAVTSNYAGQEANLNVLWTPFTGLRFRAMYGVFLPETAYWRAAGAANYTTSPVHFFEAEVGFVLR